MNWLSGVQPASMEGPIAATASRAKNIGESGLLAIITIHSHCQRAIEPKSVEMYRFYRSARPFRLRESGKMGSHDGRTYVSHFFMRIVTLLIMWTGLP